MGTCTLCHRPPVIRFRPKVAISPELLELHLCERCYTREVKERLPAARSAAVERTMRELLRRGFRATGETLRRARLEAGVGLCSCTCCERDRAVAREKREAAAARKRWETPDAVALEQHRTFARDFSPGLRLLAGGAK